jgi:integration host factor subunit beta
MTKSELIEALAKAEGITLKAAESAVNVTFQSMEQSLVSSDRLEIRGFGSFKVKDYEGYKGRNPKTGALIEVSSKKLPFFKVGKELKERVNGADVIDAPVKVR